MVYTEHKEMKLNRVCAGKKEMNKICVALSWCPCMGDEWLKHNSDSLKFRETIDQSNQ